MKPTHIGNVHEIYDLNNGHLIILKTDRISVLGSLLPKPIKNKGIIQNKITKFWFNMTKDIIPNHVINTDTKNMPTYFQDDNFRDRVMLVEKLDIIPFEFIVRGYIFGRMWKAYKSGETFCGNKIAGNYQMAEKLHSPIITPTRKGSNGHDENVEIKEVETVLGRNATKFIINKCFELYKICSQYAILKGLIIADTKFEFGINKSKQIILADEIFTPDSSRYWDLNDYKVGFSPKSFDKQLFRDWLLNNQKDGHYLYNEIPDNLYNETEIRYKECLSKIVS